MQRSWRALIKKSVSDQTDSLVSDSFALTNLRSRVIRPSPTSECIMRPAVLASLSIACALVACAADPSTPPDASSNEIIVRPPQPLACPTNELAFTQQTGCRNDGYVEFCLPKGDDAALASVTTIAPTVKCFQSGGGRAQCNDSQVICFFP